jgi:hypothetical protein
LQQSNQLFGRKTHFAVPFAPIWFQRGIFGCFPGLNGNDEQERSDRSSQEQLCKPEYSCRIDRQQGSREYSPCSVGRVNFTKSGADFTLMRTNSASSEAFRVLLARLLALHVQRLLLRPTLRVPMNRSTCYQIVPPLQ